MSGCMPLLSQLLWLRFGNEMSFVLFKYFTNSFLPKIGPGKKGLIVYRTAFQNAVVTGTLEKEVMDG